MLQPLPFRFQEIYVDWGKRCVETHSRVNLGDMLHALDYGLTMPVGGRGGVRPA